MERGGVTIQSTTFNPKKEPETGSFFVGSAGIDRECRNRLQYIKLSTRYLGDQFA
jgi:hypothetical protein